MAFTTTVGAGGTSLIGTSGVDTTTFAPGTLATAVFIGAQGENDFVTLQTNQANNYTVRGGAGVDTITAAGFRNSLVTGDDGNDTITVTGTIQSATVSGLEGVDTIAVQDINGGLVNGNNGNDILSSGATAASAFTNNGKLVGGQGNDAITLGAGGAVTLTSGLVNGQDGDDTITITNVAAMTLGGGSTIFGGQGSDIFTTAAALASNLVVSGDLGADNITTAVGNDTIFGGDGNDRITAAAGFDSIIGGSGVDTIVQTGNVSNFAAVTTTGVTYTFVAGGPDVVSDFSAGLNGDILSMGGGSVAADALTTVAEFSANKAANTVYAVSGNYDATTRVFTVTLAGSGSDTLLLTNQSGVASDFDTQIIAGTNNSNALLLSGINVNTLTASNFA